MIRLLQILALCVLFAAGGVFALSVSRWRHEDSPKGGICTRPSAVETFKAKGRGAADCLAARPALMVQAEAFAALLNPEKKTGNDGIPQRPQRATEENRIGQTALRPSAPSATFRLRATSCYPGQPEKSRALIGEAGASEGSERWVKQGTQIGHFVIQEIGRGSITYRDGDQVRQMSVEPAAGRPRLVQGLRPGTRQISAATEEDLTQRR